MRKKIIIAITLVLILVGCFLSYYSGYVVGRKQIVDLELRIVELEKEVEELELENLYKTKTIELMKEGIKKLSDKLIFVDEPFVDEIIPILQKMEFEEDWVKLDAYLKECIEFWFPEHSK